MLARGQWLSRGRSICRGKGEITGSKEGFHGTMRQLSWNEGGLTGRLGLWSCALE